MPPLQLTLVPSPIGPLTLAVRRGRVCALRFGDERDRVVAEWRQREPGLPVEAASDPGGALSLLGAYFAGDLDALDRIEVEMAGTVFQQRVWTALRDVRAGRTASYSDIARAIGTPAAVRAVGAANGANPVALIVPCHRIIGARGALTGYGGGLERKRWLLQHEGVLLAV